MGLDEIEEAGQGRVTEHLPASIPNIFDAPVGGFQQHTHNSTRYINQTVPVTGKPDFDNAVAKLPELIRASAMSDDEKVELENDVKAANKLALKENDPSTLERAKLKLDHLKTTLTATDVALKAAPYSLLYTISFKE